nr:PDDEXK nuclease domain-containing protein [Candidatus Kapabacteria bacterium]
MTINKKTARIQKNADNELFKEIKNIIQESRFTVSNLVNSNLTMLFWNIGNRIKKEILKGSRAEYGKEIVANISLKLISEFGNSYSVKNLWRMIQFVEIFPNKEKVVSLIRHLSWTHFIALLPLKDELQREFYIELCRLEKWSVRILRKQINSMLYERTALSRKPDELINYEIQELKDNDFIDKDIVLKDPYILDFLGLKDRYLEKDLEDAILIEMENFILELGIGFAFIARQKRIQIDNEDFFIDLLFYNRKLNRLVVIDLKIGEFKAEF